MQLLRSLSDAPAINSALEAYILTERPGEDVLLFYINRPAVIVGRNQCIEAEIDLSYCHSHGIEVVRRLSGGGTVYHDYGNINYAFLCDKAAGGVLDRDFNTPMIKALDLLGIHATAGARKELLLDGFKISGTASHVTRNRQLFHGTLLYRADLQQLGAALQGDRSLRGKRVASVSSPVINLSEALDLTEETESFLQRLAAAFARRYQTDPMSNVPEEMMQQARLRCENAL
ncbi:MAG: lipoate--protein ligase family protein [Alistipes sp.]|nr:lipoate--protein ligase family protein [Alistipes sp.]